MKKSASSGPNGLGNPNADFEQKFIRDALFTPGWIAACHLGNKLPQPGGNARSSSLPRLVLPKQTETFAMPPDQRVGFDDGEGIPPVEQARQSGQCKTDGIGRPARFRFSLDKESELFTQEQIFSSDSGGGPETELYKGQCVEKDAKDSPKRVQNR
jgi:hypothetical protein